eukprot:718085_1
MVLIGEKDLNVHVHRNINQMFAKKKKPSALFKKKPSLDDKHNEKINQQMMIQQQVIDTQSKAIDAYQKKCESLQNQVNLLQTSSKPKAFKQPRLSFTNVPKLSFTKSTSLAIIDQKKVQNLNLAKIHVQIKILQKST